MGLIKFVMSHICYGLAQIGLGGLFKLCILGFILLSNGLDEFAYYKPISFI